MHLPRGSAVKLYHSSSRTHGFGSVAVAGCVGSSTFTVAVWNWFAPAGWFRNQAPPIMSPFHSQLRSALAEAWMPTMPAAALRPALERRSLCAVEDAFAVGVEEDDDLERPQPGVGEERRVLALGDVELEPGLDRHGIDRRLPGGYRLGVPEAGGA